MKQEENFFIVGRDHPATYRSGQIFIVVHARVNQREEAYHIPFWLHTAHGHVEFIIHSYINKKQLNAHQYLFHPIIR